jgi:DNA polymerase/3'-5' exonuclease PolX
MSREVRLPRGLVVPVTRILVKALEPHYKRLKVGGSLRRGDPTIGDIDIVTSGPEEGFDPGAEMAKHFQLQEVKEGKDGPRKCWKLIAFTPTGKSFPIKVDIWTVPEENWGGALMYVTGSGVFNVIMHRWARYKGLELNLQGVLKDGKIIASKTEEDCFKALGWEWISPAERSHHEKYCAKYLEEMNSAAA